MNKYWIPHLDIHKKVITQELQYYLGPEATVRPYTREVWRCVPEKTSLADKATIGRRRLLDNHAGTMPDRCEL